MLRILQDLIGQPTLHHPPMFPNKLLTAALLFVVAVIVIPVIHFAVQMYINALFSSGLHKYGNYIGMVTLNRLLQFCIHLYE